MVEMERLEEKKPRNEEFQGKQLYPELFLQHHVDRLVECRLLSDHAILFVVVPSEIEKLQ